MKYPRVLVFGIVIGLCLLNYPFVDSHSLNEESRISEKNMKEPVRLSEEQTDRFLPEVDVPSWSIGDRWTYSVDLFQRWIDGTDFIRMNITITMTVSNIEEYTLAGEDHLAYNVTLTNSGEGWAQFGPTTYYIDGAEEQEPDPSEPGNGLGYRIYRVSDLAMLYNEYTVHGYVHVFNMTGNGEWFVTPGNIFYNTSFFGGADNFDFPISPGEYFSINAEHNRSGIVYLPELGYYATNYQYTYPYIFNVTTTQKKLSSVPAGIFSVYEQNGIGSTGSVSSTFNQSWCPDVKNVVKEDMSYVQTTPTGLIDQNWVLLSYDLVPNPNSIHLYSDTLLPNIPLNVMGSFPGNRWDDIIVAFPDAGISVETVTDWYGNFNATIITPAINDSTPEDISLGVVAYPKDDLTSLVAKSIVIVDSDDSVPFAYAGPDQVADEDNIVYLDGSQSGDDMAIRNYTWAFEHNDTAFKLYGETASFLFTHPGICLVNLSVTDYGDNTHLDMMQISINDRTPPVPVIPERITVNEGDYAVFDASDCFDPETEPGDIADFTWTFTYDGSNITLTGEQVSFRFHIAGSYLVNLNISDPAGNFAIDSLLVQVNDITEPTAVAGEDIVIDQNQEVTLDGSGSSDNSGIVSFIWTFTYEGAKQELHGGKVSFTFDTAGIYTVMLNVTDEEGNSASDIVTITVKDIVGPIAMAGYPQTLDQHSNVIFNGGGSRDNVGIDNYTWKFTYDGGQKILYGMVRSFTFDLAGTYVVTLKVTDAAGNYDTSTLTVTVRDITDPLAVAGDDITVNKYTSVHFNGNKSEDNVAIVTWVWSFAYKGEIQTLNGAETDFFFDVSGSYTINLQVIDETGLSDTDTLLVTVNEEIKVEIPPDVVIETDLEDDRGDVVAKVKVSGSGTLDVKKMEWKVVEEEVEEPENIEKQHIGIFMEITLDELDWMEIKIPYNEYDLPLGIDESTIRLYFWNSTTSKWEVVANSKVNVYENFIWANVTHLTLFAPLGDETPVEEEEDDAKDDKYSGIVVFAVVIFVIMVIMNILFSILLLKKRKAFSREDHFYEEEEEMGGVHETKKTKDRKRKRKRFSKGRMKKEEELEEEETEDEGIIPVCPECGEEVEDDDDNCSFCGATLRKIEEIEDKSEDEDAKEMFVKDNICPECGEDVDEDEDLCSYCGARLTDYRIKKALEDISEDHEELVSKKLVGFDQKVISFGSDEKEDIDDLKKSKEKGDGVIGNLADLDEDTRHEIETLLLKGVVYSTNKEYNKALSVYDEALGSYPNNPNAWYLKGVTYTSMGLPDMAATCIDESILLSKDITSFIQQVIIPTTSMIRERRKSENIRKLLKKGVFFAAREDYNQALKNYDKVIVADPANADAWYLKAVVYSAMGSREMSKRCLIESAHMRKDIGISMDDLLKDVKEKSGIKDEELEDIPILEVIEEVEYQCSACGEPIDENDASCPNCGVKFKSQRYKEDTVEYEFEISDHGYWDFDDF